VESFGARLKQERERRKMELQDVANSTKISVRMLQALEEDRFDRLPGGIFNKGFVRAYARHLGLDEAQTLADFLAASSPSEPAENPDHVVAAIAAQAAVTRPKRPGGAERVPWGKLAFALLLVAVGFALWGSYSREVHSEQVSAKRHSSSAQASGAPAASSISGQAMKSAEHPPLAASAGEIIPSPSPASLAPTAGDAFTVLIRASDDSWLTITADGQAVMNDTLAAGAEKSVSARKSLVVKAGNVGGLDFYFNGKKVSFPGEDEEVRTLSFDSSGLQSPTAKAQNPANPAQAQP